VCSVSTQRLKAAEKRRAVEERQAQRIAAGGKPRGRPRKAAAVAAVSAAVAANGPAAVRSESWYDPDCDSEDEEGWQVLYPAIPWWGAQPSHALSEDEDEDDDIFLGMNGAQYFEGVEDFYYDNEDDRFYRIRW